MFTTTAETRASDALKRIRTAACRGARWKIWVFYAQHTPVTWGALAYLLIAVTGSLYSLAFYRLFEINIFGFFDTSDFLLSGLQNVKIMLIGFATVFFVILAYFFFAYNSIFSRAYRRDEQKQRFLKRRRAGRMLVVLSVALILLIPPRLGWREGNGLPKKTRLVWVTTQQDADRPTIRLPEPALLEAIS